jgi:hypothetical protein
VARPLARGRTVRSTTGAGRFWRLYPERLDESSTASCEELMLVGVPWKDVTMRLRPGSDGEPLTGHLPRREVSLAEYLDGED